MKRFLNWFGRKLGETILRFGPKPQIQTTAKEPDRLNVTLEQTKDNSKGITQSVVQEKVLVNDGVSTKLEPLVDKRKVVLGEIFVNALPDDEPLPDCVASTKKTRKPRKKAVKPTKRPNLGFREVKKKTTKKKGK